MVVLYLFYSCSPHLGLPSGVWHGVMRCHGQGWGNRTTGVRCPGVYGATGRLVACIALGHGSDKPGAGMDTDTEKRHVRSSTGPFTNRPELHSASVFLQTFRPSYTFRGTGVGEIKDT